MPSSRRLWRITDQASFEALRRGRRGRAGTVTVTYLPPAARALGPADPPRVGFSVGRRSGSAVARNRIRRRLRAALQELRARDGLPAGTYLVGASPAAATQPWAALVADVEAAVGAATEDGR